MICQRGAVLATSLHRAHRRFWDVLDVDSEEPLSCGDWSRGVDKDSRVTYCDEIPSIFVNRLSITADRCPSAVGKAVSQLYLTTAGNVCND